MSEEEIQKAYKNEKKEEIIRELFYKCIANKELVEEIERLHSIIKEVREYINKNGILDLNGYDLLEILDKTEENTNGKV